jgi:hypothetical protein
MFCFLWYSYSRLDFVYSGRLRLLVSALIFFFLVHRRDKKGVISMVTSLHFLYYSRFALLYACYDSLSKVLISHGIRVENPFGSFWN